MKHNNEAFRLAASPVFDLEKDLDRTYAQIDLDLSRTERLSGVGLSMGIILVLSVVTWTAILAPAWLVIRCL